MTKSGSSLLLLPTLCSAQRGSGRVRVRPSQTRLQQPWRLAMVVLVCPFRAGGSRVMPARSRAVLGVEKTTSEGATSHITMLSSHKIFVDTADNCLFCSYPPILFHNSNFCNKANPFASRINPVVCGGRDAAGTISNTATRTDDHGTFVLRAIRSICTRISIAVRFREERLFFQSITSV